MIEIGYRSLEHQDYFPLHAMVSDLHVTRQLSSWPHPSDPALTRSRCAPYDGNGFVWGVFTDIGLIGTVGVTDGDLGYMLDRRYWDRGVGSRIVADALTEGFSTLGLGQITASAWFDNASSIRILEKHGFVETHRTIEIAMARDVPTPSISFVLTRDAYNVLRDQAE